MVTMKRVLFLLAFSAMALTAADVAAVRSVYLLPMGSGLDQFLAERLTNEHVFLVVTDPKLADAVFTDRIGSAFEEKLADLTAPPAPEKAPEKQGAKEPPATQPANGQSAAEKGAADKSAPAAAGGLPTEAVNRLSNPAANSSFGRGRGTIFLVDVKSKQVIWSVYEAPKSSDSGQLDRRAYDIVSRLKKDLRKPEGGKP
jgi:hypothetical protein